MNPICKKHNRELRAMEDLWYCVDCDDFILVQGGQKETIPRERVLKTGWSSRSTVQLRPVFPPTKIWNNKTDDWWEKEAHKKVKPKRTKKQKELEKQK